MNKPAYMTAASETRQGMAALLLSLGFEQMAEDVKTAENETLPRYARVIVKNIRDESIKSRVLKHFYAIGLPVAK